MKVSTDSASRPPPPPDPADWPAVLDGELMRVGDAMIPATDDGLIRGDGAFDAFSVHDGRPFARKAHIDRLERSCAAMRLPCPRALIDADIDLLLGSSPHGDAVVRVILTRGGRRLSRLESIDHGEDLTLPVRMLPVVYDPSVVLNGVKSLSYAANMLASRRAVAEGYDEALLVRSDGVVLEGPTCTVFWVAGSRLCTPALETGILASITRRVIVERLDVQEGSFGLEDLLGAEEAFLASTARLAQPIAAIGQSRFRSAPGPQTVRAQQELHAAIAAGAIA
jgi:branched-chain amino acid aminotransferase